MTNEKSCHPKKAPRMKTEDLYEYEDFFDGDLTVIQEVVGSYEHFFREDKVAAEKLAMKVRRYINRIYP